MSINIHPKTIQLYKKLQSSEIGDVIYYKDLTRLIECDVQFTGRSYLNTARKNLQNEHGIMFAVLKNEGLKRLCDIEKIEQGEKSIKKISKAIKRGGDKLKAIDVSSLDNASKVKVFAKMSIISALSLFTKKKTIKELEGRIDKDQKVMNYKPDLSLFK